MTVSCSLGRIARNFWPWLCAVMPGFLAKAGKGIFWVAFYMTTSACIPILVFVLVDWSLSGNLPETWNSRSLLQMYGLGWSFMLMAVVVLIVAAVVIAGPWYLLYLIIREICAFDPEGAEPVGSGDGGDQSGAESHDRS
ncbi:hypothetical protein HNP46_000512 [Pseudomonas nitritireducens]|uniref:Uncharacterized protein n=1 Tax=Pseudomonas nitroreducens TaxID=46680 RepID=A0A7W7KF40_PSENT|nr:hypothetical protein [Pseudomonas nitritireducens]MBB4861701.1 hypothetical protein [Pseudomonas nitritireducens]